MSAGILQKISFDELELLEDQTGQRHELWDGQPVAMTGGTRAHNLIALGLRDALKTRLPPQCDVFVADMGLRLSAAASSDKAYPDVMAVCDAEHGAYQTNPVLIAEVLSESSVSRDRKRKFKAYTSLKSVETYLILSQTAIEVEVYQRVDNWTEEVYRGEQAMIELSQPKISIPLQEIYRDVWDELA